MSKVIPNSWWVQPNSLPTQAATIVPQDICSSQLCIDSLKQYNNSGATGSCGSPNNPYSGITCIQLSDWPVSECRYCHLPCSTLAAMG